MARRGRAPYIGVTGFSAPEDAREALGCFFPGSARKLMVGVLASSRTLGGGRSRQSARYPDVGRIAAIFQDHPAALNLVHYSTADRGTLFGQLRRLVRFTGPYCHGFQLNIAWPDVPELRRFRSECPGARIVLQLGRRALEEAQGRTGGLAGAVGGYLGLIDDVLYDGSGGRGLPLDAARASDVLGELAGLAAQEAGFNLGVAGGLGPESLHLVEPLLGRFPDLSIDAEAGLRDPVTDALDREKVTVYLRRALSMFR